jgi:hypothetical protein
VNANFKASLVLTACLMLMGACSAQAASSKLVPSGTVVINQTQAGAVVTAGFGGGTLRTHGRSYKFSIGGMGLGGLGASSLTASGTVYNLKSARYFAGKYFALRTGAVVGNKSFGRVRLKNQNGVYMDLTARRKGLMLSTGLDGMVVTLK